MDFFLIEKLDWRFGNAMDWQNELSRLDLKSSGRNQDPAVFEKQNTYLIELVLKCIHTVVVLKKSENVIMRLQINQKTTK